MQIEVGQNTLTITIGNEMRPTKDVTISYPLPEEENIVANITGAYLLGYDLIHIRRVKSIPIQDRQNIRDSIRKLVGMEIVEGGGIHHLRPIPAGRGHAESPKDTQEDERHSSRDVW